MLPSDTLQLQVPEQHERLWGSILTCCMKVERSKNIQREAVGRLTGQGEGRGAGQEETEKTRGNSWEEAWRLG